MRTNCGHNLCYLPSSDLTKRLIHTVASWQPVKHIVGVLFVGILLIASGMTQAQTPATAAWAFIETLSSDEAREALAAFNSSDRTEIRYTPGRRGGLSFKAMDADTLTAARRFLKQTLSAEGVRMIELIRQREAILGEMTGRPDYRDPELYYLAIFGDPGKDLWSYRFEGHHLSINMTYRADNLISGVPIMLASNPEKTDARGAPPELLQPLVNQARASISDRSAKQRVIESLTAHIPPPLRDTYRKALSDRQAFTNQKKTWRGFDLAGGDTLLEIETNQTNHIHITFRDGVWDFGGTK